MIPFIKQMKWTMRTFVEKCLYYIRLVQMDRMHEWRQPTLILQVVGITTQAQKLSFVGCAA